MPSGLENTIIKVMKVDTAEYDLLFSVSSWPSICMCLVGGILIDRILGLRLGLFIVVNIALAGQLIWATGAFVDQYYVMLAGRLLVGAGNDLTVVTSHAFKAIWFKDHLSFAMSIDTTFSRIGGALALVVPELINRRLTFIASPLYRLGITLFTAAGGLMVAVLFTVAIIILDVKRESEAKKNTKRFKRIKLEDIKEFSHSYWIAVAINVTYFPTVYAFVSIGQLFFIQKYGLSLNTANIANSLVFGATIISTPIIGFIVDKTGFNLIWVIVGVLIALATHLTLAASYMLIYVPFIATVLYSLSYTLVGPAFSPVPALLVGKEQLATAYGIFRSNYNLSFSIITIVTGIIVDKLGYFVLELFFSCLTIVAFTLVMLLIASDASSDIPKINIPGWKPRGKENEDQLLKEKSDEIKACEDKKMPSD